MGASGLLHVPPFDQVCARYPLLHGTNVTVGGRPRSRWRRTVILGAAALTSLSLAPHGAAASTAAVQANNFHFCAADAAACTPADSGFQLTVAAGTQVTWTYRDTECDAVVPCPGHNVTFADAAGKTIKQEGATLLTRVFDTPGRFEYRCTIHAGFGMTGVVVVQGQPATPSAGGTTAATSSVGATASGTSPTAAELPKTGLRTTRAVGLGVILLLVGAAAIAASRRRRA